MLAWGALWLALGGLAVASGRKDDRRSHRNGHRAGIFAGILGGAGAAAFGVLILGMRSLLLAVKVVSDGPIYHLYFAVRWWKAGRLILVAAPFGENAATYFPGERRPVVYLVDGELGGRSAGEDRAGTVPRSGCRRGVRVRTGAGARRSASLIAACWFAASTPLLLYSSSQTWTRSSSRAT